MSDERRESTSQPSKARPFPATPPARTRYSRGRRAPRRCAASGLRSCTRCRPAACPPCGRSRARSARGREQRGPWTGERGLTQSTASRRARDGSRRSDSGQVTDAQHQPTRYRWAGHTMHGLVPLSSMSPPSRAAPCTVVSDANLCRGMRYGFNISSQRSRRLPCGSSAHLCSRPALVAEPAGASGPEPPVARGSGRL